MDEQTYKIRRFYLDEDKGPDLIKTGLTLEEAQAHCQSSETHSKLPDGTVEWFDGYDKE